MAQLRVQVEMGIPTTLPRDVAVTTFHLDTDAGTDYESLADDVGPLFASTIGPMQGGVTRYRTKIYDLADAEPRLPRADVVFDAAFGASENGPREVALCLSYYAGRNLPRLRGRMYIGPVARSVMAERPSETTRQRLADLAEGLSGLGGPNVQWVQYSPTTQDFTNVSDYFIDDEWDTMRSRGLRSTTRTTGTVDG